MSQPTPRRYRRGNVGGSGDSETNKVRVSTLKELVESKENAQFIVRGNGNTILVIGKRVRDNKVGYYAMFGVLEVIQSRFYPIKRYHWAGPIRARNINLLMNRLYVIKDVLDNTDLDSLAIANM